MSHFSDASSARIMVPISNPGWYFCNTNRLNEAQNLAVAISLTSFVHAWLEAFLLRLDARIGDGVKRRVANRRRWRSRIGDHSKTHGFGIETHPK